MEPWVTDALGAAKTRAAKTDLINALMVKTASGGYKLDPDSRKAEDACMCLVIWPRDSANARARARSGARRSKKSQRLITIGKRQWACRKC